MDFSQETKDSIEKDLLKREDVIVDMIPVNVFIDGMLVDIDHEDREGGEIRLFINSDICCYEKNKHYKLVEVEDE